jgi:hypothetical protein
MFGPPCLSFAIHRVLAIPTSSHNGSALLHLLIVVNGITANVSRILVLEDVDFVLCEFPG